MYKKLCFSIRVLTMVWLLYRDLFCLMGRNRIRDLKIMFIYK